MKVTVKGIAANVVTVKFKLACKCHVLADFQKNANFWKKKQTEICQKFHTDFGRVFSVSYIHNLPGNI